MLRIGLFWKIFGSYVGLVLASTLLVGLFASGPTRQESADETERFLRSKLDLLEAYYRQSLETGALDAFVERVATLEGDTRLTIIAPDGRVLADSAEDVRDMENHLHRPEVLAARETGAGTSRRYSNTVQSELMYAARRVDGEDGGILGYVRVSRPEREVRALSNRLRSSILVATLAAIGIGLLLAWIFARRFVVPVRRLTSAASALSTGEYGRVKVESHDELGELARAFNRMSEELRERIQTISTERSELRAILSGMVEGVVAVDEDGKIVLMNSGACSMLGVVPGESAGKSLWEGVPVRPVAEVIAHTLDSQRIEQSEVSVAEAPHDRVLQLHAAPLNAAEGRRGAVLVMHDITELRRLERVRRDFVANASHELKTPVAAIRGLVETILEDESMPAETQAAFLERVQRQTRRLSDLIGEMLRLSKLESADSAAPRERLDLRDAVRGALDTVHPLADERGVRVRTSLPDAPTPVRGSGEALERIVVNLLENAVKFTPEGGTVDLRVETADGQVVLEVQDEGPGIPMAERGRVFERFYRIDRGRSREVGGTGLGLAIVKHLVQGLGGDVGVVEGADRGSVFRVSLPAA